MLSKSRQVRLLYKLHEKPLGNGLRRSIVKLCKVGQKSLSMFQQLQALSVLVLKVLIIMRMDYGLVSRVFLWDMEENIDNHGYISTSILRIYRIYRRYIGGYSGKKYR